MQECTNRINIVNDIIELVQKGKIKSINCNNEIIDITNIRTKKDLLLEGDVKVSNKFIPLLNYDFKYLKEFLTHTNNYNLITNKGKYLTFNITYHAVEQICKRLLYIYVINTKFQFSLKLTTWFENNLDKLVDKIKNFKEDKEIDYFTSEVCNIESEFDSFTYELLDLLLYDSSLLITENSIRMRDRLSFKRRDKERGKCDRYLLHPFLFVIQDGVLKTVELYSPSIDCRHLNKFTSDYKKYNKWLYETFKD